MSKHPSGQVANACAYLEHYHMRHSNQAALTRIRGPKTATPNGIYPGVTIYVCSDQNWKRDIDELIAPAMDESKEAKPATDRGKTFCEIIALAYHQLKPPAPLPEQLADLLYLREQISIRIETLRDTVEERKTASVQ